MDPLKAQCYEIRRRLTLNEGIPYDLLRNLGTFMEERMARVAVAVENQAWMYLIDELIYILGAHVGSTLVSISR